MPAMLASIRSAQSSLKDHSLCMVVDSGVVKGTKLEYCLTLLFKKG